MKHKRDGGNYKNNSERHVRTARGNTLLRSGKNCFSHPFLMYKSMRPQTGYTEGENYVILVHTLSINTTEPRRIGIHRSGG